ncbi:hypothetical protein AB3M83_11590 [Microbacterium sp. 179-B 1A2 NHS]|uniref:hypothetical protein n=1 Tax=Microbacterium sp. 179-B 1A2 NHS TaxID=3142383 RepID=UPI0039A0F39C
MSENDQQSTDENAYEGPDVETSTSDTATASGDGGGLGEDGTIPDDPDGLAAGHTGTKSTFEPEEDEAAG